MTRRRRPALGYVTLAALAADLGVNPATLRQRIARGTLAAEKVGTLWLVPLGEADRARALGRGGRSR